MLNYRVAAKERALTPRGSADN